jgi:hypothetical protein
MKRRSRTRRMLKWIGTVTVLIVALVWFLSGYYEIGVGIGRMTVGVEGGAFGITGPRVRGSVVSHQNLGMFAYATPVVERLRGEWVIIVPLWCVLALVGAPTLLMWHLDRRIPPGHCQRCGYDLTGNVSGRCPECGTEV